MSLARSTYRQKTKIIATIGPATSSVEQLRTLILEGANILRLNFSHGTHESHQAVIEKIRKLNQELKLHCCILQDLQGPKLRIGEIKNGTATLNVGARLRITTRKILGDAQCLSTDYAQLIQDVNIGQSILLSDGTLELRVLEIESKEDLLAEVIYGGLIRSRQGINLPDTILSVHALTEKDTQDLAFGLSLGIDWVALSFVRSASDVHQLRDYIEQNNGQAKVMAKIEKPEALRNLDEIIDASDGIMIARGDLGVEIPTERVPVEQKKIIRACHEAGRPVVVATHMLESMVHGTRPTRAEATDVANAVMEGADVLMLSAETAVGKHPIIALQTMRRILQTVEKEYSNDALYEKMHVLSSSSPRFVSDELILSACRLRKALEARAIVALTNSGYSGFRIASFRPETDILVFSSEASTIGALNLAWGVHSFYYDGVNSTDETIVDIEHMLCEAGYLRTGDIFIMLISMPISMRSLTNTIKVNVVSSPKVRKRLLRKA